MKADVDPAADGEDEDKDYDWRKDAESIAIQSTYIRQVYEYLDRTDVPQNLMPTLEVMAPLFERDTKEWRRVMGFALTDETFWKPNMQKKWKKHQGSPIGYFVANFESIRGQADEADAKAAKKSGAK